MLFLSTDDSCFSLLLKRLEKVFDNTLFIIHLFLTLFQFIQYTLGSMRSYIWVHMTKVLLAIKLFEDTCHRFHHFLVIILVFHLNAHSFKISQISSRYFIHQIPVLYVYNLFSLTDRSRTSRFFSINQIFLKILMQLLLGVILKGGLMGIVNDLIFI